MRDRDCVCMRYFGFPLPTIGGRVSSTFESDGHREMFVCPLTPALFPEVRVSEIDAVFG